MAKLLSLKGYAAHRRALGLSGGTLQAVQTAVKVGRISNIDGKIDPEVGDREWLANTDQMKVPPPREEGVEREDLNVARARKESALADVAEMEAAEMRGEMLRAKDVSDYWGEMLAALRARALVLPTMVAPLIAPAGKTAEAQGILRKYVYEMLQELSESGIPASTKKRRDRRVEDPETAA